MESIYGDGYWGVCHVYHSRGVNSCFMSAICDRLLKTTEITAGEIDKHQHGQCVRLVDLE